MGEIRNRHGFAADLAGKLSHFLMRAFQELVQNAKFIHDLKRGWMDCVAPEITQKIRVFFEHENVNALARKKEAKHHPGGTASGDATASVDRVIHTHQS
jgi:hypothetical protein